MTESLNFGALPLILHAPGIRPDGFIAIGLNPIMLSSIDHPPFGPGLPPDNSPEGQKRNKVANQLQKQTFALAQEAFKQALTQVGARVPDAFLLDVLYTLPDRFIQLCSPSVEYPRSDAPSTLRFAGGYPKASQGGFKPEKPTWWNEVTTAKTKKIVFVCQGTVSTDLQQLVYPTMTAFEDRPDVMVVVAIGQEGATVPPGVHIPSNSRVADYIPYHDILPYCDAFVTTGGYGAFQSALYNGCPLVMSATTEEKPETTARAEWAGVAVNLRTSHPSAEQLRKAVDEILHNQKYKTRALEIQTEIVEYDPVEVIIETIEDLARQR